MKDIKLIFQFDLKGQKYFKDSKIINNQKKKYEMHLEKKVNFGIYLFVNLKFSFFFFSLFSYYL
jgi:hypothetical protein